MVSSERSYRWMALFALLQSCSNSDAFGMNGNNSGGKAAPSKALVPMPKAAGAVPLMRGMTQMRAGGRRGDFNRAFDRAGGDRGGRDYDRMNERGSSGGRYERSYERSRNRREDRRSERSSVAVQQALDKIDRMLQNENNYDKLSNVKGRLQNVLMRTVNGEVDDVAYEELDSILEGTLQRMNKLEVLGLLDMLREEEYSLMGPGPFQQYGQYGPNNGPYQQQQYGPNNGPAGPYGRDFNRDPRGDTRRRDFDNRFELENRPRESRDNWYRNSRENTDRNDYARNDYSTENTWWEGNPRTDDHYKGYQRNDYDTYPNYNRDNSYNSYGKDYSKRDNVNNDDRWQQGTAFQRNTDSYFGHSRENNRDNNDNYGRDYNVNSRKDWTNDYDTNSYADDYSYNNRDSTNMNYNREGDWWQPNSQSNNNNSMNQRDNYVMARRGNEPPSLWNNHMDYRNSPGRKIDWSDPVFYDNRNGGPNEYYNNNNSYGPSPYGDGYYNSPGGRPNEYNNFDRDYYSDNWYSPGHDHKMGYSHNDANVNMYNRDNDFSNFSRRGN